MATCDEAERARRGGSATRAMKIIPFVIRPIGVGGFFGYPLNGFFDSTL
jgi:hypothetical protein